MTLKIIGFRVLTSTLRPVPGFPRAVRFFSIHSFKTQPKLLSPKELSWFYFFYRKLEIIKYELP
jgi:hypothetical protein